MAEENKSHEYEAKVGEEGGSVESKDRGLFDFLGKKEDKKEEEKHDHHDHGHGHDFHHQQDVAIAGEFEKVKVSEAEPVAAYHHVEEPKHKEEEEKKPGLLEKLRRSDSSSSSVSTHMFFSLSI